jgi:tetratricopeptide (TPR) repeat protein
MAKLDKTPGPTDTEYYNVVTDHDNPDQESCRIQPDGQVVEDSFSLKTLDRLDKLAVFAVVAMLIAGLIIIASYSGRENPAVSGSGVSRQAVVIISPEFDNKLKITKTLLNSGNLPKARELINSMIKDYPYDGRPYMLLGDLYVHNQQPILAMLEYRKGVDLNPDFLDKKAKKLFRGKQIKNILTEARQVIKAGLAERPGDPQLKQQLETLYYMLRRVAGSCG